MSGDFKTRPATTTTLGDPGPKPVRALGDLPFPTTSNRYEEDLVLGSGGMSRVTLCKDTLIGRQVALKALDETRAESAKLRTRFLREARVQAQLEHPAIVPVYTMGRDEHGTEYFTMQRVSGVTLAYVIGGLAHGDPDYAERFPRNKLLTIFRQLCLAVDYAHTRGVIHRDLKPINIMIGNYGEVYILDWGIAKFVGGVDENDAEAERSGAFSTGGGSNPENLPVVDRDDAEATTAHGQMLGTPGYMAPEQTADSHLVNELADIYSLGAILFELLTLSPLHRGKSPKDRMRSTRKGFTEAPSERAAGVDVPPELDRICLKATAFAPWERFGSARELFEAIDRFLEGERDAELRRDVATRHAAAAERAVHEARAPDQSQLNIAAREAARALTLNPDSRAAQRVLMKVMLEPPPTTPAEVERALEDEAIEEGRFAAVLGGAAYSVFLVCALVLAWVGMRSWVVFTWIVVPLLAAAAFCATKVRHAWKIQWLNAAPASIFSAIAIGAASGLFGPLVLVPTLATANTIALNVANLRRVRWAHLACGCAAVIVPTLLEWAGWWRPAYAFRDATMIILPRAAVFPGWMNAVVLLLGSVLTILAPALVLWRLNDTLDDLRKRLLVQVWHLEQLIATRADAKNGGVPWRDVE